MGKAVIGRGTAKGKDRAINAVEDALHGSLRERILTSVVKKGNSGAL
ncbi:MAG: hypothetical protein Ct9H300mP28_06320 [Pseudomonadota bacterium]|nr:MAG: hypothetical protein Ct9H300mP28_06320 [Pseudomonadota bacterium]